MTTKEAFKELIYKRSIWNMLDIPKENVLYFRYRMKHNKKIEIEIMEKLLLKGGYKVLQEKEWNEK